MVRLIVNFVFLTMSTFQPVSFSSQLNIIFLKRQKQFIVSLTYEVFYTIKILGLPKAGSLLVEDKWVAEMQKKKKKKKRKNKQTLIYVLIRLNSYLRRSGEISSCRNTCVFIYSSCLWWDGWWGWGFSFYSPFSFQFLNWT